MKKIIITRLFLSSLFFATVSAHQDHMIETTQILGKVMRNYEKTFASPSLLLYLKNEANHLLKDPHYVAQKEMSLALCITLRGMQYSVIQNQRLLQQAEQDLRQVAHNMQEPYARSAQMDKEMRRTISQLTRIDDALTYLMMKFNITKIPSVQELEQMHQNMIEKLNKMKANYAKDWKTPDTYQLSHVVFYLLGRRLMNNNDAHHYERFLEFCRTLVASRPFVS